MHRMNKFQPKSKSRKGKKQETRWERTNQQPTLNQKQKILNQHKGFNDEENFGIIKPNQNSENFSEALNQTASSYQKQEFK